jgi:S1-C subfamily serine protease
MKTHPIRTIFLTALISAVVTLALLRWDLVPGYERPWRPAEARVEGASPPAGQPPLSADEDTNIRVYNKISPGVVNITSIVVEFDFFLSPVAKPGTGSGAVLDRDGNVVTNYHVVASARELEVALPDQTKYRATVVGADPPNDIAVIKIDARPERLHPVPLGESGGLRVGQKVLAIGNPFRLQNTLTTGIISSLGRTIQTDSGDRIENIIQTDAAINPGNSGGPLLNTAGEMIGINTSIVSTIGGGSLGIGFAVPVNTVRRVTNDLIKHGRVLRPSLGVEGYTITEYLSTGLDLPVDRGVLVARVYRGSAAESSDIRGASAVAVLSNERVLVGGDIITHVDGKAITSSADLRLALEGKRPGDTVQITLYRGRSKVEKSVLLTEPPRQRGFRF